jgi:hypothetical protein
VAEPTRLELAASGVTGRRYNQLNYGSAWIDRGGRNRDRTCDPRLVRPMLSQLSYSPSQRERISNLGLVLLSTEFCVCKPSPSSVVGTTSPGLFSILLRRDVQEHVGVPGGSLTRFWNASRPESAGVRQRGSHPLFLEEVLDSLAFVDMGMVIP